MPNPVSPQTANGRWMYPRLPVQVNTTLSSPPVLKNGDQFRPTGKIHGNETPCEVPSPFFTEQTSRQISLAGTGRTLDLAIEITAAGSRPLPKPSGQQLDCTSDPRPAIPDLRWASTVPATTRLHGRHTVDTEDQNQVQSHFALTGGTSNS